MPRSDSLRREISALEVKGAGLTKDLAKQQELANKATAAAGKKRAEAIRTKSDSTHRAATSSAEREERKAADSLKKVGEGQTKIAANNKLIYAKQTSLAGALKEALRS